MFVEQLTLDEKKNIPQSDESLRFYLEECIDKLDDKSAYNDRDKLTNSYLVQRSNQCGENQDWA